MLYNTTRNYPAEPRHYTDPHVLPPFYSRNFRREISRLWFREFFPLLRDRAASFRVGGLKKNAWRKIFWGGRRGGGMLVDFHSISLKWRRMRITIKLLIFFHIFSDVAIGSENSPSLNWKIIDCRMLYYWYQPLITINKPEIQLFCLSCLELKAV